MKFKGKRLSSVGLLGLFSMVYVSAGAEVTKPVRLSVDSDEVNFGKVLIPSVSQPREQEQSSQGQTQRERRVQAYAKLLEGERYFSTVADGDSQNKLKAAQGAFSEAIQLDPTLVEAHTALAEVAFYLDDFDGSIREAQVAIKLAPDNFGAHRVLSRVLSIRSGLRESTLDPQATGLAIAELKEVIRLSNDDPEAWALLGEFYRAQGHFDLAIDAFKHWAAAPPSDDPHFFQIFTQGTDLSPDAGSARLADTLLMAGRPVEALAAARNALLANPDNKEYAEVLGRALEANGSDDPKLIAELQQILIQNPKNTNLALSIAKAEARAGRSDEAANTLSSAIARKPSDDRELMLLRVELAQTYAEALRFDDAIAVYEELLKQKKIVGDGEVSDDNKRFAGAVLQRIVELQLDAEQSAKALDTVARMRKLLGPSDPAADTEYYTVLKDQGKRQEAMEAAKAAAAKFPANGDFVRMQSEALTALGRVDDAAALMKTRLKGTLSDFTVLLTISGLYMDAGKGPEAVEFAKKALAIVPSDRTDLASAGTISLASAQERAGDAAGAEQSLRSILKKEPDNPTVLNNLGYFLAERNDRLPEAVDLIQKALKQEPTNPSYMDSLGWAYFKLGKMDQAERYLTDAARRSRSSAAIQEHLGELYVKQQKSDKAIAAFRRARAFTVEKESSERIDARIKALEAK